MHKIESVHADVGVFNGQVAFQVDGRLLLIEVCTPTFNDYNEWRLTNLRIASGKYDPSQNDVELTPYDIPEYIIDQDELDFLDKWFPTKMVALSDLESQSSPHHYLGYEQLVSVNYDEGFKHLVNRPELWREELDSFDTDENSWVLAKDFQRRKLHEPQGMYSLLIFMAEHIRANYYKK
ncbi:hypothetical protein NVP1081O_082 [Vibrio phage 1.081.O._10N.286.52.C2]|nr:hypothetical protein NVP1081O_082 [Vibrio phage 1.081.O._10N.286.52.C2]